MPSLSRTSKSDWQNIYRMRLSRRWTRQRASFWAFEELDEILTEQLRERCSWVYEEPPLLEVNGDGSTAVKDSVFGEVESEW